MPMSSRRDHFAGLLSDENEYAQRLLRQVQQAPGKAALPAAGQGEQPSSDAGGYSRRLHYEPVCLTVVSIAVYSKGLRLIVASQGPFAYSGIEC